VIGISSYPRFLVTPYDAASIAAQYYYPLKKSTSRPVFFAEVGWYSSETVFPSSSESKQADFVHRLIEIIQPLDVEAVNWVAIRDLRDIPALAQLKNMLPQFFSLGLKGPEGERKSAWLEWKRLKEGTLYPRTIEPTAPATAGPARARVTAVTYFSFDGNKENFVGIGSSKDVRVTRDAGKVREGKGALQWKYVIAAKPFPMLLRQDIDARGGSRLSFWLKSQRPTKIGIVLMERDGGRFEHRLNIESTDWRKYDIALADFASGEEADSVNVEEAQRLAFIDISAFAGGSGENTIWLDELRID